MSPADTAHELLKLAERDYQAALILARAESPQTDAAGFHLQQAAEKSLGASNRMECAPGLVLRPCHSRAGGNPVTPRLSWTPAFAGVTEGSHVPFILLEPPRSSWPTSTPFSIP